MKWKIFNLILLLFLGRQLPAQEAKLRIKDFTPRYTISSFKVLGMCGLCTKRILNALKIDGVKSAYWDQEDQELTVQYDRSKVTPNQLYTKLAVAGHDTEKLKAPDEIYQKLPACCHYNRAVFGAVTEINQEKIEQFIH